MTDDTPLTPTEELDALAGEYVLGVLALPERLAAEARVKRDPAFAAAVARWEARFDGLNDGFAPVTPPAHLLGQIEARLFPPAPRPQRRWLGWALGGLAAAALGLAVVLFAPPATDTIVAELGSTETGLAYEARHDGQMLRITRIAGTGPAAGQDHELWIIAPNAAPVSLGLLGDQALQVEYPAPPAGWVLAVSVEPAGGSPTGAPTGPVILTAEIGA